MCNVNYPKFPGRISSKNVHHKDKTVQCDLFEFVFILHVIILIIQITNIIKISMNPGIA